MGVAFSVCVITACCLCHLRLVVVAGGGERLHRRRGDTWCCDCC
jgi:hypothetical protein